MTRQQALISHLLQGGKLSIMSSYKLFGICHISREVRRLIEIPFNVELTRTWKEGKTKYGSHCNWLEYTLTANKMNAKGIKEMRKALVTKGKKSVKNVAKMSGKV